MALVLTLSTCPSFALELCPRWTKTETLFNLPRALMPEVSGLAASKKFPGRYYLVNDSGDGGKFYALDLPSGKIQQIEIKGFKGWDIEALSVGPCGSKSSCVYVGDIGDNSEKRKIIRVAAVEERQIYSSAVSPTFHTQLTYPDGPTDSEGFVVTREGRLILFSKEFALLMSEPTKIYSIEQRQLLQQGKQELTKMGEMHIWGIAPVLTVTDAALSPDEKSLFLLGYLRSYEVPFDEFLIQASSPQAQFSISSNEFYAGVAYQNEAATYSMDSDAIVWTYESPKADGPLMSRNCIR